MYFGYIVFWCKYTIWRKENGRKMLRERYNCSDLYSITQDAKGRIWMGKDYSV